MKPTSNIHALLLGLLAFGAGWYLLSNRNSTQLRANNVASSAELSETQAKRMLESIAHGRALYLENCQDCHHMRRRHNEFLFGAVDRYGMDWLIPYTRNAMKMVREGDPIAVKLYNEFGQAEMPAMEHLAPVDVQAIYHYIQFEQKRF